VLGPVAFWAPAGNAHVRANAVTRNPFPTLFNFVFIIAVPLDVEWHFEEMSDGHFEGSAIQTNVTGEQFTALSGATYNGGRRVTLDIDRVGHRLRVNRLFSESRFAVRRRGWYATRRYSAEAPTFQGLW
jgi:hypothetical protein